MSQTFDAIVFDSNSMGFKVRMDSTLRKLGITFITCYDEWLEINFRGGYRVTVSYPESIDALSDAVESGLRLRTELFESNIRTISYYISDYLEEIKAALKHTK